MPKTPSLVVVLGAVAASLTSGGAGRALADGPAGGGAGGRTADYLRAPADGGDAARCDWFARLKRFVDETKRDCDEGRAVKPGPITRSILDRCRAEQGAAYDQKPIGDLLDGFGRQVQSEGFGNACHEIKQQAWDLIEQ